MKLVPFFIPVYRDTTRPPWKIRAGLAMYAALGPYDLILIVNLPGIREAMEASVALSKLTNIAFTTCPAVSVERFDEMIEVDLKKYASDGKTPTV